MPPRRNVTDNPSTQRTATPIIPDPILDNPPTPHHREDTEPRDHDSVDETPNLAEAIALMTAELRNRDSKKSGIKAKAPDTFDGSDPKKLNNFILLCTLYFRSNRAYNDDSDKVTFALSYLRGAALEYSSLLGHYP